MIAFLVIVVIIPIILTRTWGSESLKFTESTGWIGDMLKAIYPEWSEVEKYDINWTEVCESPDRFRRFDYDAIADYVEDEKEDNDDKG